MLKPLVALLTGSKPKTPEPYLEIYTTTLDDTPFRINFSTPNSTEQFLAFAKSQVKPTQDLLATFITHGYMSHIKKEGEYFYDMKNAILNHDGTKPQLVILVDWSSYSGTLFDYSSAIHNVPKVSSWVAQFVKVLRTEFMGQVYIHGIGFSLGAHLMGNVAEGLGENSESGRKHFDRITGLDPAGPGIIFKKGIFSMMEHQTVRLRREHAEFVDVIHTSDHLGTSTSLGHVDFYPNWGCTQKGLPNIGYLNVPSHIFCLKLFLHTILDEDKEKYRSTLHIRDLETKQLDDIPDKAATMGYFCHSETRGMFYVDIGHV